MSGHEAGATMTTGTGGSHDPAGLQPTTLMYLFAVEWLTSEIQRAALSTPMGRVERDTACANFVKCALLQLADEGLVELELVSEATSTGVIAFGGASNVRVHPAAGPGARPGLEGRLLAALATTHPPEGRIDEWITERSGEHPHGVRNILRSAQVLRSYAYPWESIVNPMFTEVFERGLVARRGRFIKRMTVTDEARVAALRPAFDETRARFATLSERDRVLTEAMVQDTSIYVRTHRDSR